MVLIIVRRGKEGLLTIIIVTCGSNINGAYHYQDRRERDVGNTNGTIDNRHAYYYQRREEGMHQ